MRSESMKPLWTLALSAALSAPLLAACGGQTYYAEDPTFSESGTVAATAYYPVEREYRTVYRTEYVPVYRTEVRPVYEYRLGPYVHVDDEPTVYERRIIAHDHKGFISRHHLTYGR